MMFLKPALAIVGCLVAATVMSGCVGKYTSEFSVVVVNNAANGIHVLANGNQLGQVAAGQSGSFSLQLSETNPNAFTNGVAPTPQGQVTFSATDVRTGVSSSAKRLTLSQSAPTYVTFSADDFTASVVTGASFTFSPTTPGLNQDVSFNASASTPSNGSFNWNLGDGATASGVMHTHRYARPGNYTVILTVTNGGQSATAARTVSVSTSSPQVAASFTFSPLTPDPNQEVFFNAWASTPSDGRFTWDFGDGTRGSTAAPSHRYAEGGTYRITLTVSNDAGQSATTSRTITIRSDPYGDVIGACRSYRDVTLVACVNSFVHGHDEQSDLEVVKRVAWILKLEGEDGGLLVKPGGDNIWSWRGYSFSTSRVCTPLSWIWKIFSDAGRGGANAPIWTDNGPTSETGSFCVPAMDPILP